MFARSNREYKRILGIALGGGRGKNTVVTCLDLTGDRPKVVMVSPRDEDGRVWYDNVLSKFVMDSPRTTLLALDAPLTLPACIRCKERICTGVLECTDPAVKWFVRNAVGEKSFPRKRFGRKPEFTPYTQRVCEKFLEKQYDIKVREGLGSSIGPITARAQHLLRRWSPDYVLHRNLLEVNPKVTISLAFGTSIALDYRRGPETWETRASILEQLGGWVDFVVWREMILQSRRRFKSLICAITAFLWLKHGWDYPEGMSEIGEEDGWIWAPMDGL